jgi:hypothetical protein
MLFGFRGYYFRRPRRFVGQREVHRLDIRDAGGAVPGPIREIAGRRASPRGGRHGDTSDSISLNRDIVNNTFGRIFTEAGDGASHIRPALRPSTRLPSARAVGNLQSRTPFVLSDVQADQAAIWNKTAVALTSHGHAPKPTVKQVLGLASLQGRMSLGSRPKVSNRHAGDGKLAGVTDEPALEVRCRYLEMELQAKYVGPVSESLVSASFGLGQIYSPGRKIEGVAVPMQNHPVLGKRGKARAHPLWRESYRRETGLPSFLTR